MFPGLLAPAMQALLPGTGQRFERATVFGVVGVDRIVVQPRANEIVILWIIIFRPLESRRRRVIDPQRFHPGVADVAGVAGSGHARAAARHGTTIAAGEKLQLLQREMGQLIEADEQKLRALILVNVIFVAAVAEAGGRAVIPRDHVLGFVVVFVKFFRDVAAEISEQRRFELRISAAQQQRVAAGRTQRFVNCFPQQRFGFSRAGGAAKQAILCARVVKLTLARKRLVIPRKFQISAQVSFPGRLFYGVRQPGYRTP